MKRLFVASVMVLFLSASGCIPTPERRVVVAPRPEARAVPLLPVDLLDKKIDFLNEILQEEGISDKDKDIASNLLEDYQALKEASSTHLTEAEHRKIVRSLFDRLSVLDETYFSKEKDLTWDFSGPISLFSSKRNEIMDAYLSGNFKGVINKCLELKKSFGPDALTSDIGLVFALSLGKEGVLDEAINIGEGITREMEASPDIIYLRAKIAEWNLSLGHKEKALYMYDRLTDNLDEREALIRRLAGRITNTPEPAIIVEDIDARHPQRKEIGDKDLSSMDRLLQDVGLLVRRHAYDEARLLLIKHRIRVEEGPDMEIIDQALKSVELAKVEFEKQKLSEEAYKNETIELARNLIEKEEFEKAITKLEELKDPQEISAESEALKEKAIEKLINRERNRAARFFLEAKKTEDPLKKQEYLRSSYDILKTLIEKYPSSSLNNKLKSHIKRVAEELDKLGTTPER